MRTSPPSTATVRPGGMRLPSSALGPLTFRTFPSFLTSTPFGIATGILPMRDTCVSPGSPDVAEDLAAQLLFPCLLAGHDPAGRREDGDSETAQDLGDRLGRRVDPPPRS